jgi:cobalt/nickel transport system permease protein
MSNYDPNARLNDSFLARIEPRCKLILLGSLIICTASLKSTGLITIALFLAVLLLISARPERQWLLDRMLTFCFVLIPIVVLVPFQDSDGFSWPDPARIMTTVSLAIRMLALLFLSLAGIASTSLLSLVGSLSGYRLLQTPMTILFFSFRFLFLAVEELSRIRVALRLRAFRNQGNRRSWITVGAVAGSLLLRASDRANRVSEAMRTRGFQGKIPYLDPQSTDRLSLILASISIITCIASVWVDHCWREATP